MTEVQSAVDAALSRWSILVQLGIVAVLATLSTLTWLSTRRAVVLTWTLAWISDTAALTCVLGITLLHEGLENTGVFILYMGYTTAKMLFAFLLALGLFQYRRVPAAMGRTAVRGGLLGIAAWSVAVCLAASEPVHIQALTYVGVSLLLVGAALPALGRSATPGARVVAAALLFHGALFLHHAAVLAPTFWGGTAPTYMSRISFVDAISEFLVGLACVLAMGLRALEEARAANRRMEASEQTIRRLVDADPLTGLWNRRRLRPFVEAAGEGGMVFFIDVDRFKAINDSWGHATGDACLLRVAATMEQVFRTTDGLFRIGGDEFLVVAPGMDPEEAARRARELREHLAKTDERGIALSVSVGTAPFGGDLRFDEAMAQADAAMYRAKAAHR